LLRGFGAGSWKTIPECWHCSGEPDAMLGNVPEVFALGVNRLSG
jgi:hypothetical protein